MTQEQINNIKIWAGFIYISGPTNKAKLQCTPREHIIEGSYYKIRDGARTCKYCDIEERLNNIDLWGFTAISDNLAGKLRVKCKCCSFEFNRPYDEFIRSIYKSCPNCDTIKIRNEKLSNFVLWCVEPLSEDWGEKLQVKFINCGHIVNRTYKKFIDGCVDCPSCKYETPEERLRFISSTGYTAISKNLANSLVLECPKGHEFSRAYSNFKNNPTCPECLIDSKKSFLNSVGLASGNNNYGKHMIVKCKEKGHTFTRAFHDISAKGIVSCPVCFPRIPNEELEIGDYIISLGIEIIRSNRNIIGPREIDIYIPEKHIGIEYNGVTWHTENNFGFNLDANKNYRYHYNKFMACKHKGIQLLSFDSTEWSNKASIIRSMISNKLGKCSTKIYARKCVVKDVDNSIAIEFLNTNHIQGNVGASIKLGLYYNNTLVSLMCFSNNNVQYELVRFVSLLDTVVIGGASKLFNYFTSNYEPKTIVSFSDNRWFSGELYEHLGFIKQHDQPPSYEYIHKNNQTTKFHKSNFTKQKILNKFTELKGLSITDFEEYPMMQTLGFDRIWDCGKVKWVYTPPNK